jgi:hypothetical protein
MKTHYLGSALLYLAFAISTVSAQEVVEFEGPDNARIYVMEGEFKQTASIQQNGGTLYYSTDMAATMDVNSGAMSSVGSILAEGTGNSNGLPYELTMNWALAMKAVYKQAGDAVRWSGKAAMTGPMTIRSYLYGLESVNVVGTFVYDNMTLDPATGEQTGTMSYRAVALNSYGQRFPLSQPPTLTTFPRPTIYSSEGEWREAAGDWSSEIVADVYPNGKITGTGDLIVGDPEDPYANVDQNVKGKLNSKTGVVSLSGTGATKGTSKVKVTLNYVNSTGDTVAGKSSVNAYAQKRKF